MKVLITGASGFTGNSLIRFLASRKNVSITGLARKDYHNLIRVQRLSWVFTDILDPAVLSQTVSLVNPDAIVHLAGLTRGPLSELRDANVAGTKNLLDAVLQVNPGCPIVVVSSSAVYGDAGNIPIKESHALKPVSDYGISKTEQENLCRHYIQSQGCQITIARPFNLIGPDQPAFFVCGRIIQQVLEMKQGTRKTLDLMETGSRRDFIDVRDIVKGYWALLSHPEFRNACAGRAFNLGSGIPHSVADVIHILETITGDNYPVRLPREPIPISISCQQSDNTCISAATGWRPTLSLSDSLLDMLDAAGKQTGSSL